MNNRSRVLLFLFFSSRRCVRRVASGIRQIPVRHGAHFAGAAQSHRIPVSGAGGSAPEEPAGRPGAVLLHQPERQQNESLPDVQRRVP